MADEALRLQRLFNEADIPVLFVKGASLAMLAFGTLGLSIGQDIDLLVPFKALPKASAMLMDEAIGATTLPPRLVTRSCGSCCGCAEILALSIKRREYSLSCIGDFS